MAMKRIVAVGTGMVVGVVGAAAYFLDPRSGKKRRAAVKRGSAKVKREGEKVARRSAHIATMMGGARHPEHHDSVAEIYEALVAAIGVPGETLSVVVSDEAVTARGEVDRLGQIAAVSRVLTSLAGNREVVNLVRLRASGDGAVAVAG